MRTLHRLGQSCVDRRNLRDIVSEIAVRDLLAESHQSATNLKHSAIENKRKNKGRREAGEQECGDRTRREIERGEKAHQRSGFACLVDVQKVTARRGLGNKGKRNERKRNEMERGIVQVQRFRASFL